MIKKLLFGSCAPANKSNPVASLSKVWIFLLLLAGINSVSAQTVANSYNFSESSGNTYVPITGGAVLSSGDAAVPTTFNNNISGAIALPFSFKFNGLVSPSVYVSENGFITFGSAPTATNYTPIISSEAYSGCVSAYGVNANHAYSVAAHAGTVSEVSYKTIGTTPNQVFVVQYKDIIRRQTVSNLNGLMNMQIRLYETTNEIEVVYKENFTSSSATVTYGSVGLRGTTNLDVNSRKNAAVLWPPTSASAGALPLVTTETAQLSNSIGYKAGTVLKWTPCFTPTGLTLAMQGDNSTLDISFTAPNIPPASYDYEVRTANAAGSGAAGLFASGSITGGVAVPNPAVSVPGLAIGTTYTIYVKANCKSTWVAATYITGSITPSCPLASIPYTEDFEGVTVPALPTCTSTVVVSGAAMVTQIGSITPDYGFSNKNLKTNSAVASDTWFFTRPIDFTVGLPPGKYKLSYKYGGTRQLSSYVQKMKVAIGPNKAATAAGMTGGTVLADHDNIRSSPLTNIVNFTVPNGTYYIGFNGYAGATNGTLQIDDISVTLSSCFAPTGLTSAQVTSSSALISWTAPASSPSGGYEYYYATVASGLSPINTTAPSGSTGAGGVIANLSGLTASTAYNFWVRSNCGGGDVSEWSTSGTFTTSAPYVTTCNPSGSGYSQDLNGITNVTMGSINNTTGIETNNYGDYSNLSTNVAQGATVPVNITYRTGFTYDTTIWVDWNGDGDFVDAGEIVYTGVSTSASPTTLAASFAVPAGASLGQHRIRIGGLDYGPTNGAPIDENPFSNPCRNGRYQAYEDYTIYVITAPPALTISDPDRTETICSGGTTSLITVTSNKPDFQVYTWTPSGGVSGSLAAGYTFNPTTTTTYTLTATQTSGNFSSNSVTFTVVVNQPPTPITISPAVASICGAPQALTASGGIVSGVVVLNEDFNGVSNSFVTNNTASFGGTPANSDWTLRPNGFYVRFNNIYSNDTSQFYVSDSDAQGSGGTTNSWIETPEFSLVGFTDAALSFWHYYHHLSGSAIVEISTDVAHATYTPLPGYTYTSNQGTASVFANAIIDLSSYVGQANVKIRWRYSNATYAWCWAIDNVKITGSASSDVTWTPTTGLYTDAAGTTSYGGGPAKTVYAQPASATTYTATANSLTTPVCSTSTTVSVTYSSTTWTTAWSNGTPDNTKAAIFAGDYSSTGNLQACSVIVNSGNVVINSGHVLTSQNSVKVNGGTLTFENNASLMQGSTNTVNNNTGNITYKRITTPVTKFDYTYWSSPVFPQTLANFSPTTLSDKYYWFNPVAYQWSQVAVPGLTNMTPGQGYIIRGPQANISASAWQGSFVGIPNNGNYTPQISGTNSVVYTSATQNLNCIGNPYPSALSADLLMSGNPTTLGTGTTLYFWTHNTPITNNNYTFSDYATYNYSGGVGTAAASGSNSNIPNGKIAAGQGFVIKAIATGAVNFKNTMRLGGTGDNSQFYRTNEPETGLTSLERNRVWLELKNDVGAYKQILVGYIQNATNEYDNGYDGEVLEAGNPIGFYSILNEKQMAIQGRALPFVDTDQVPLGIKIPAAGSFQVNIRQFDGLFEDETTNILLEDKLLNVIHDLRQGTYSFVSDAGNFDNRFVLRFNESSLGLKSVFDQNAVIVYKQQQAIYVETSNVEMKSVQVYDIEGRLILEKANVNSKITAFENLNLANQVLVVKVTSIDGATASKKIIF